MSEERDAERKKTYNAEKLVRDISARGGSVEMFGTTVTWPNERRFGHLEHIEAYLEQIQRMSWFRAQWEVAAGIPVRVRRRKSGNYAHYERYPIPAIAVPDEQYGKPGWAMRELVVLHELAHHVHDWEKMGGAAHGTEFREVFVALVSAVIGAEAGWLLQTAFMDAGLRVIAPSA